LQQAPLLPNWVLTLLARMHLHLMCILGHPRRKHKSWQLV